MLCTTVFVLFFKVDPISINTVQISGKYLVIIFHLWIHPPLLCRTHSSWVLLFLMKSGTASLLSLTVSFQSIVDMIWQLQVHAQAITYMHLWSKLCNINRGYLKTITVGEKVKQNKKENQKMETNLLPNKLL